MEEGFGAERTRRQQDYDIESLKKRDDYNYMEKTMTAKKKKKASGTSNRPDNKLTRR